MPSLMLAAAFAAATAAPVIQVRARAIAPGEVMLVTVTRAGAGADVTVRAFDREWPAYADGASRWCALVGIDLDTRPGRYEIVATSGSARVSRPIVVQRRAFRTRRLTVNPDLVHPPPEMEARVVRESERLEGLWTQTTPERVWSSAFVRPVADRANSAFGTRSVYNGEARPPHTGADFLSPAGRPIHAPNAGRVVLAEPLYFSGKTVIVDHGLGLYSLLAHLSEIDVKAGDMVAPGDVIGKVGATGRVTGAHLHWALRLNNARVDPLSLLYATRSGAGGAQHKGE